MGGAARIRLTILHSNDIHGRVEKLARIATLVERIKQETPHRVLYVDCGDVEETTSRLSNLTKGVAMHRLLATAGCEAAAVGNAVWLRYGPQAVSDQALVAPYPLLCANLKPIDGVRDTARVDSVGFVGVTDTFARFRNEFDFGVDGLPVVQTVRDHARRLRADGAELVVLLSHMGLPPYTVEESDELLARELADDVDLILGAHTHHELPEGMTVGSVLIAQAGSFGEWLGRVDVDDTHMSATLIPVGDDVPPHPAVLAEAERAERELDAHLDEVLAVLDEPLDPQWVAEMLRRRMAADVGLAISGVALERTLPAGPLRRGDLWEACHTGANPGVADVPGSVLQGMLERGASRAFQEERPRPLRGRANGPLHVAGSADIDPVRTYRVAGTDGELSASGGLLDESLPARYDFPTILREAIEEDLARTKQR